MKGGVVSVATPSQKPLPFQPVRRVVRDHDERADGDEVADVGAADERHGGDVMDEHGPVVRPPRLHKERQHLVPERPAAFVDVLKSG